MNIQSKNSHNIQKISAIIFIQSKNTCDNKLKFIVMFSLSTKSELPYLNPKVEDSRIVRRAHFEMHYLVTCMDCGSRLRECIVCRGCIATKYHVHEEFQI